MLHVDDLEIEARFLHDELGLSWLLTEEQGDPKMIWAKGRRDVTNQ
jgi:hypothetical protein